MSADDKTTNSHPKSGLFEEACRQLTICNACQYCEGYCPVFPSLELRPLLRKGDIMHLANLCHDCRDCFYACMYSPPHPFAVNPPRLFSELRRATYDEIINIHSWWVPAWLRDRRGLVFISLCLVTVVSWIAIADRRLPSPLGGRIGSGSPYGVIHYSTILLFGFILCGRSAFIMVLLAMRYWAQIQGSSDSRVSCSSLFKTLSYSSDLRYLKGGGLGCAYPDEEMSPLRRRLHAATMYGIFALLASTISAAVMQDLLHLNPPYPVLSIPVLFGIVGGISMIFGCTGMILIKISVDRTPSDSQMTIRDYKLLIALDLLGITGFLALILRNHAASGVALLIHFAIVLTAFAIAPYTKFVHFIYRMLSILKDNMDREGCGI